jgi:hypothetical protein
MEIFPRGGPLPTPEREAQPREHGEKGSAKFNAGQETKNPRLASGFGPRWRIVLCF